MTRYLSVLCLLCSVAQASEPLRRKPPEVQRSLWKRTLQASPFIVQGSKTIKARAFQSSYLPSDVTQAIWRK